MASESLHAPRERLSQESLLLHQAIVSLMEELEAVDWYRQRADDCDDDELRDVLLHNMREEMEHAAMVLEWIRRHSADFDGHLRTYLFSTGSLLQLEAAQEEAEQVSDRPEGATQAGSAAPGASQRPGPLRAFTVGAIKD